MYYTMMELSTAHITEQDNSILNYMGQKAAHPGKYAPFNMGSTEYGYVIFIPSDYPVEEMKKQADEYLESPTPAYLAGKKLSESFWKVLEYAKKDGHRCVYIDRDAETIDGLDTHDW
jgi:hypothetical protein